MRVYDVNDNTRYLIEARSRSKEDEPNIKTITIHDTEEVSIKQMIEELESSVMFSSPIGQKPKPVTVVVTYKEGRKKVHVYSSSVYGITPEKYIESIKNYINETTES